MRKSHHLPGSTKNSRYYSTKIRMCSTFHVMVRLSTLSLPTVHKPHSSQAPQFTSPTVHKPHSSQVPQFTSSSQGWRPQSRTAAPVRDGGPSQGRRPQSGTAAPVRDGGPSQGQRPQSGTAAPVRDGGPSQGRRPQSGTAAPVRDGGPSQGRRPQSGTAASPASSSSSPMLSSLCDCRYRDLRSCRPCCTLTSSSGRRSRTYCS